MTAADVIAAHARQETPQRTPAKLKTSEIFDARTNFQSRASVHTLPKMEQRQPREHANVIPGHRQMGELQLKDAILDCQTAPGVGHAPRRQIVRPHARDEQDGARGPLWEHRPGSD